MLADLLSENYETDLEESWVNERTATGTRREAFWRRPFGRSPSAYATGCSLRETTAILVELGVKHSHGAVWILPGDPMRLLKHGLM